MYFEFADISQESFFFLANHLCSRLLSNIVVAKNRMNAIGTDKFHCKLMTVLWRTLMMTWWMM